MQQLKQALLQLEVSRLLVLQRQAQVVALPLLVLQLEVLQLAQQGLVWLLLFQSLQDEHRPEQLNQLEHQLQ
jgi:hypothetical protein